MIGAMCGGNAKIEQSAKEQHSMALLAAEKVALLCDAKE